jgi:hypothetical protein
MDGDYIIISNGIMDYVFFQLMYDDQVGVIN